MTPDEKVVKIKELEQRFLVKLEDIKKEFQLKLKELSQDAQKEKVDSLKKELGI
jgi:hypothetical protein